MFYQCYFIFFKCRICHSTTGGRIAARIVALTPSMKTLLRLKFGELRSRDVAMATNFVARVSENWHTPSSFCELAFNNG